MKVNIIGRQMNVWDEMKRTIEEKLSKLDKYFNDECTATVVLSCKRSGKCMEITINAAGTLFRSEVEDETFRNALDHALYAIERQIRKNKTRLERRLRTENAPIKVAVMGCAVNGPGEAREADIGIAGGDGCGLIFKKGQILRKVPENELLDELMKEIDKL
mgnify:CR=1 FL=1